MRQPTAAPNATMYPQDIGRALSRYRRRNGLTLQDVSNSIGVSIGTLSKLENEKASPSFRTLMRIVQHLDLSTAPPAPPPSTARKTVTRRSDVLVAHSDKGEFHIHATDLLHKAMFPMTSRISLREAPPIERWTSHPGDEFVYVLEGTIEVFVEEYSPYLVHQGESTYYDSGMRHVLIARGGRDSLVLSVSTSAPTDGIISRSSPEED